MAAVAPQSSPSKRLRAAQPSCILVLFRTTDLRLHDNHALAAAVAESAGHTAIIPAFVWSRCEDGHTWGVRGASEVYLKQALARLGTSLTRRGSRLILRRAGENSSAATFADELVALATECNARSVHYNIEHTPEALARDAAATDALRTRLPSCHATAHRSQLLYAPDVVALGGGYNGGHWGTLMPFLRACEKGGQPPRCLPAPGVGDIVPPDTTAAAAAGGGRWPESCRLDELRLAVMPASGSSNWGATIEAVWQPAAGEEAAQDACLDFVATGMLRYERERSRADLFGSRGGGNSSSAAGSGGAGVGDTADATTRAQQPAPAACERSTATSQLSVALRFGELSPRFLYWAIRDARLPREVTKTFSRRLHWRDLAYYQLSCFPEMRSRGIRLHYDATQWVGPAAEYRRRLQAWQQGMTGYPLVDAGMRELYLVSGRFHILCGRFDWDFPICCVSLS
jgi:deoxyribodipyrimidine photolyase